MVDRSGAAARAVRLVAAAWLLAVVVLVLAAPSSPAQASYVPVVPPATVSEVDPTEVVDDEPGAKQPDGVDPSGEPAIARLSQTGVEAGALALTGLALVAVGGAVVRLAHGRSRSGWY